MESYDIVRGKINLEDDFIHIKDGAQQSKYMLLAASIIWIGLGVERLYSYYLGDGSISDRNIGFIQLIAHFLLVTFLVLKSSASKIKHTDIKEVRFKANKYDYSVTFMLNKGKRTVKLPLEGCEKIYEYCLRHDIYVPKKNNFLEKENS